CHHLLTVEHHSQWYCQSYPLLATSNDSEIDRRDHAALLKKAPFLSVPRQKIHAAADGRANYPTQMANSRYQNASHHFQCSLYSSEIPGPLRRPAIQELVGSIHQQSGVRVTDVGAWLLPLGQVLHLLQNPARH